MAKTIIGTVSSNASDKTIVVKVERRKTHPLYRKQYTETTKFMAHDVNSFNNDGVVCRLGSQYLTSLAPVFTASNNHGVALLQPDFILLRHLIVPPEPG